MANSARNLPGSEERRVQNNEVDINPLDNVEAFYENNKKNINTITTVILLVIIGYFAYTKLYKGPAEEKAATALSFSQLYFSADSLNLALNGDGKNMGFTKIASKYSSTSAGNLAHYYEGVCYLKMGDAKSAIKALKEFNGKGTVIGAQAYGALGEAYMETGDKTNAIDCFKKASEDKNNGITTPMFLFQLALAYDANGNSAEAKAAFKRIRDEFPKSIQARDIDKELARLGELN